MFMMMPQWFKKDSLWRKILMPLHDTLRNLRNNSPVVPVLCLHTFAITTQTTKEITDALKTNTALNSFRTDSNYLGDEGAKDFAEVLAVNRGLQCMALWGARIGPVGAKFLAKSLKTNQVLKELTLGMNFINSKGTKYFAKALKDNASLTELNLYHNQLGDKGAKYIAKALRKSKKRWFNRSLLSLNLGHNQIGNKGAVKLLVALETNFAITHLSLEGNNIDNAIQTKINELLHRNIIARNEFLLASEQGDLNKVKQLYEKGVSIHATKEKRITALRLAAQNGHVAVFKYLVDKGALDQTITSDHQSILELMFHYRTSHSNPTTPTVNHKKESPVTPTSNTVRFLAQCWEERTKQKTLRGTGTAAESSAPEERNASVNAPS
jgi:hypothetical protein